ncbi:S9 family peptidase [Flavihumibacter petaseus]|uniref:Peptidase S9 family protein n=1 Tax=Flavihumibacter petaseus NBRC 106054 TaxID=1220578 RepID=A0A0E9MXH8_9BACT|nr:prolyl oligopeptidase family serine peptidase [Flavihumibacter petaseus]GAO42126.1 peptidase S9 family protein [Flavihumibacter petaseus NBRC 106054]
MKHLKSFLLLAAIAPAVTSIAQMAPATTMPFYPERAEMMKRYVAARQLDSLAKNTIFKTSVRAVWSPDGKYFLYQNLLADSVMECIGVDVAKGTKYKPVDLEQLTGKLGREYQQQLNATKLPIRINQYDPARKMIAFTYQKDRWIYRLDNSELTKDSSSPVPPDYSRGNGWTARSRWMDFQTDSVSPDKQWVIRQDGYSAEICAIGDSTRKPFSFRGTPDNYYGNLSWSPDGKYVVGYRIKEVEDSMIYYVIKAKPNTTRGQLKSIHYKQPGDPFTTFEMFIIRLDGSAPAKVNTEVIDFFGAPALHWAKQDGTRFLYEKVDRGHQRFRIIEVDATSGNTRTIYDERATTFQYESRIYTAYLNDTDEILLSSEKEGWRQLYLIDANTGKLKNKITTGNWLTREVDSIDMKKRQVWFRGSGKNPAEDPYYVHHYRIDFSGKNLIELNPEPGTHQVQYAPGGKYFLDTRSEVNVAPVTILRNAADGKKLMDIETADISRYLKLGLPLTESFHAKGRDGVTEIWGIVCRPADFDPSRTYPVIENIYAGPQDAFVPKSFVGYGEMQSMAALGFVVVQIDGMGTANRSKAFHDVCWKNLADAGFPDRIAWIKTLAAKYSWVDTTRVGLYGTSAGGQNALGGLLFHPEFYKAAVSACGCHDNRVDKQWWNEQWMGYPVGKHYDEQSNISNAAKLQGDLLLIVGDEDENVPPESTYRVADALIKAGKQFDFLAIPGMGHSDGGPFGRVCKRDFFVQSLLKVIPPKRNSNELSTYQER